MAGTIAVITGAGSGIGRATALELAHARRLRPRTGRSERGAVEETGRIQEQNGTPVVPSPSSATSPTSGFAVACLTR